MDWQPIETAPRDGTDILLFMPPSVMIVASYDTEPDVPGFPWKTLDGLDYRETAPTHWMPLPPPPGEAPAADLPVRNARPRE